MKKEEYDKLRDESEFTNEIIMNIWFNSYGISLIFNQKGKSDVP
jgi:hypothetical protein